MRTAWWWVMLGLLAMPFGARSECRYDSGGNSTVTFSDLPTSITLAANAPNGTILASSKQTSPLNPPVVTCGTWNWRGNRWRWNESAEYVNYGVANSRGGYLAGNITYATDIPGIGYRITHPTDYLVRYPLDGQYLDRSTFSVTSGLELIKTGSIQPGSVLPAGKLGDWQWGALVPETFVLRYAIKFIAPSCNLIADPINVTLPAVTTGMFTGIGSTSGTTPFQISLACPAGVAVTKITMHTAFPARPARAMPLASACACWTPT